MSMQDPLNAEGRTSILNVGTRILLKDMMDQFLRTLGDYKTHYSPNMSSAIRMFQEHQIHIIICEVDLSDSSAYRLVKELGGLSANDDLYFVLALEEKSEALLALAEEIEVNSVLIKPFSAADLRTQIDKYNAWKCMPKDPWKLLIAEAQLAVREKKFREAEENFRAAIAYAPDNPAPLVKAARYFLSKPDAVTAEGLLKKALILRPGYVQALTMLGTLCLGKRELDRADEFFRHAQKASPLNPDRNVEMVRLYVERCIDTCRNAVRLDPSASAAKLLLGKLLTVQKDYIGAVRELDNVQLALKDNAKLEAQTFAALSRKLGGIAK